MLGNGCKDADILGTHFILLYKFIASHVMEYLKLFC